MKMPYTTISVQKRQKTANGKQYSYWEARTTILSDGDKPSRRVTASGKTKSEARDKLMDKLTTDEKKRISELTDGSAKTLKAGLENFCEEKYKSGKWASSTYVRNKDIIANDIAPYPISKKLPLAVRRQDILDYIATLKNEEKTSDSRLNKAYALLRQYFNVLYSDDRRGNPAYDIHIGYNPSVTEDKVLTSDEANRLFNVCDELGGNADLIKFAFMIYARPGEVATLQYGDWNRTEKTLTIQRTYTYNADRKVVVSQNGHTKTRTSTRLIHLSDMAEKLLEDHYLNLGMAGILPRKTDYIWTEDSDRHKPIPYSNVRRLLNKVLKEAKISKHITPHGLRHSGITFYGKDNNQIPVISKNAGHSRTSTTTDIYQHILDEHVKDAVKSANSLNDYNFDDAD